VFGFTAGISAVSTNASTQQMQDIDAKIDDGNLSTGQFQNTSNGRYTLILE
jgi:hypothetical protein